MLKDLPFAITSPPFLIPEQSSNAEVFEVEIKGILYILKDIKVGTMAYLRAPGESMAQKASSLQFFMDVLLEYLPQNVCPTRFIIAYDRDYRPCIRVIQKKVAGQRLDSYLQGVDLKTYNIIISSLRDLNLRLQEAFSDDRIANEYFRRLINWVSYEAFIPKNVFVSSGYKLVLVDLI